jgi:hypothetical protein
MSEDELHSADAVLDFEIFISTEATVTIRCLSILYGDAGRSFAELHVVNFATHSSTRI